jgi:iron complex outermembrane recepter protein
MTSYQSIVFAGILAGIATPCIGAPRDRAYEPSAPVAPYIQDLSSFQHQNQSATSVKAWQAQIAAEAIQVTGVILNPTSTGLEISLQTPEGKVLSIDATKFRAEGTSLIADIPNALLALPQGQDFVAQNPTADVARVQVGQQTMDSIRVSVIGKNALPQSEITLKAGGLAYSLNPGADEPDEEIVVTGEGQPSYRVPTASTGTRTDTPLRDTPQSIQVVPQQVWQDQKSDRISDILRNVSGVAADDSFAGSIDRVNIRGFSTDVFLRDGFREDQFNLRETANIAQIEVLKGPASVLYGSLEPGGAINLVTKKPLDRPFYELGVSGGSLARFDLRSIFPGR